MLGMKTSRYRGIPNPETLNSAAPDIVVTLQAHRPAATATQSKRRCISWEYDRFLPKVAQVSLPLRMWLEPELRSGER